MRLTSLKQQIGTPVNDCRQSDARLTFLVVEVAQKTPACGFLLSPSRSNSRRARCAVPGLGLPQHAL